MFKKRIGKLHKENITKCPTVIHLHGHIDNKENIVLAKDQYKKSYELKGNEAKLKQSKHF